MCDLYLRHDKHKEAARDLFVLQCFTALRFSDAYNLTPEQISQNARGEYSITLRIGKKNKVEVIPIINNEVMEILKRYNYHAPPLQGKNKATKNVMANRLIKQVCAMIPEMQEIQTLDVYEGNKLVKESKPRYSFVGTHTARRTFATLEYLKGTPNNIIRIMTKHTSNDVLMKYIKTTSSHDAEMYRQFKAKQKQEKAKIVPLNQAI